MDRADVDLDDTGRPVKGGNGCAGPAMARCAPARVVSWTDARAAGRGVMAEELLPSERAGRAGAPRPHRPALFADLTDMIDAAGGTPGSSPAEVAAATAEMLVQAGRAPGDTARFVELADRAGLDTLAALWRDCDPASLPGALWALYLLRQWCQVDADEVTRLWRAGEPLAPVDAVVSGVGDYADAEAVRKLPDAVLTGVYRGDLAVALERAAAFFRVVATGRRTLGGHHLHDANGVELAARNDKVAAGLAAAAGRWRAGTLR